MEIRDPSHVGLAAMMAGAQVQQRSHLHQFVHESLGSPAQARDVAEIIHRSGDSLITSGVQSMKHDLVGELIDTLA